jgi:hypothetical protein
MRKIMKNTITKVVSTIYGTILGFVFTRMAKSIEKELTANSIEG